MPYEVRVVSYVAVALALPSAYVHASVLRAFRPPVGSSVGFMLLYVHVVYHALRSGHFPPLPVWDPRKGSRGYTSRSARISSQEQKERHTFFSPPIYLCSTRL